MTIQVLHGGDGYLYLIRSVAAHDGQQAPGESLSRYYTASGQPPGTWAGRLGAQLDVAGEVTEEQMKALFGEGLHPNAEILRASLESDGTSPEDATRAVRPGRRFPVYGDVADLRPAIARAYRERQTSLGRLLTDNERLAVKQEMAQAAFFRRAGRSPLDPVELEGGDRSTTRSAVAGYDLVFTPVKSVSVLWGLGSAATRQAIYEAHRAAVSDAIDWLERNAAYTRTGTQGQAQIDTTGVIAAVFDHWDSRAGDPDLHTHVAVSNKVCGTDGTWRSLDGRAMFAAAVSLSERYNTRIEDELRQRLGVAFAERPGGSADRRSVREIDGVPGELIAGFSKRRHSIESQYDGLVAEFRDQHGRNPTGPTRLKLYQQATLTERPDKEGGRSLQQMVDSWRSEAARLLTSQNVTTRIEQKTLNRESSPADVRVDAVADDVLSVLAATRSTWTVHHVRAETHRQSRRLTTLDRDGVVERIVGAATDPSRSLRIESPRTLAEPPQLQRADGESVFVEHASARFTTTMILDAEERIVAAARQRGAAALTPPQVEAAIRLRNDERTLNAGQTALVRAFCLSGRVVQLGLAPAGAGKTTAMRAVTDAWTSAGGAVVALAPSAAAADVLAVELGVDADTVAKFDHDNPEISWGVMILIDEAGMAGTLVLDRIVARAAAAGAVVRLVGDDQQLGAIEAGGVIRQIAHDVGAVRMHQVVRFADPAEAAATLEARDGSPDAVAFYVDRGRVVAGTSETVPAAAYEAWFSDVKNGHDALLLAASTTEVSALNARARADLVLAGQVTIEGVTLRDGNVAGIGDRVTTRRNERLLTVCGAKDWVKNGDSWCVVQTHDDGALTVRHQRHRGRVTLPAEYVRAQVELDYARTIRRSQGLTVDRAHLLVDPAMVREDLYVGLSRARHSTHLYVAIMTDPGPDHRPDVAGSAVEVLRQVIARSGAELSAVETVREAVASLGDLRRMAVEYEYAIGVCVGDRFRAAAERIHPGLVADAAWPSVAQRLHLAEAGGWSIEDILRRAEIMRSWSDARSDTEVMAHRLDLLLSHEHWRERPVPDWVAAPPSPNLPGPWESYLPSRYREMEYRIAGLVDDAERTTPPWLADVGPAGRRAAMRQVVAYRAVYDVQTAEPVGPEPAPRTRQHHAWSAARRAVEKSHRADHPTYAERLQLELERPATTHLDDSPTLTDRHGSTRHL